MAITDKISGNDQLNVPLAKLAGGISAALGLLGVIASVLVMVMSFGAEFPPDAPLTPSQVNLLLGAILAFWVIWAAGGLQLARRKVWAQRLLLALDDLAMACAAVALLAIPLVGLGSSDFFKPHRVWLVPSAGIFVIVGVVMHVLLVKASAGGSRLRYGSMVTTSAVAAAAVIVVINMIAQADYFRRDLATLGSFGPSDRTRKIIRAVDTPVTLTAVYTSAEERKKASDYRPAVAELLQAMHELNDKIKVNIVNSDTDKARVMGALRQELVKQGSKQVAFLRAFEKSSETLLKDLQGLGQQYAQLSGESYLDYWGLGADISEGLRSYTEKLGQLAPKVRQELTGLSLPDYDKLTGEVKDLLGSIQADFRKTSDKLAQLAKIPDAVKANRAKALESLRQCDAAIKAVKDSLGMATSAPTSAATTGEIANPAEMLKKYTEAAGKASKQCQDTAEVLNNIAGKDNANLLNNSAAWQVPLGGSQEMAVVVPVTALFRLLAQQLQQQATDAELVMKNAQTEYQKNYIANQLRRGISQVARMFDSSRQEVEKSIELLSKMDPASQQILRGGQDGKYFQALLQEAKGLSDAAAKLPESKGRNVTSRLSEDNILIVEAGDKIDVLGFDEVWPLKSIAPTARKETEESGKRMFNGDSAIGSKILSMTNKPFATILLAHVPAPPYLRQMMSPDYLSYFPAPESISDLRTRLESANFEVKEWDLNQPMPEETSEEKENPETSSAATKPATRSAEKEARPKILLVLPPAPAVPMGYGAPPPSGFSPEQENKVRQAIDSGARAIFLTSYIPPLMPGMVQDTYPLNDYLAKDWGITAKTDYRVISAVPDETQPDSFKIGLTQWYYMPLNSFEDTNKIGRPLRAQRVLWYDVCPVVAGKSPPKGVTFYPVLTVPAKAASIWAARDIEAIFQQVVEGGQGIIRPDFSPMADMRPPFTVALAAAREKPGAEPTRIVVLGLGMSLVNRYLESRVPTLGSDSTISFDDPPRADADVVINSAYWCVGKESVIATGPVQIKPVDVVSETTMTVLKALVIVGLPLLVVVLGGVVMVIRQRS